MTDEDTRTQYERMVAGDWYEADAEIHRLTSTAQARAERFAQAVKDGDDDAKIGPNVQLLTPIHPVDPEPRRAKLEAAEPITIGDNVWLGGGVIVCPGVTIGDNTVVGAGSVVTKDLPANVLAVGNPARVLREI